MSTLIKVLAFPKDRFSGNPHISNLYKQIETDDQFIVKDMTKTNGFLERFDIFHLHWPEFFIVKSPVKCFFRVMYFLILLLFLKMRNTKIVWTVHNLYPHSNVRPKLYLRMVKFLSHFLSGITYFSLHSKVLVHQEFTFTKSIPWVVIPHALYDYPNHPSSKKIDELQQNILCKKTAKLALFFGRIDHYKDIDGLIRSFRELPAQNYQLAIVGPCSDDQLLESLNELTQGAQHIRVLQSFFPEADLASLFSMPDLVILPFKKILNSGSVMLALSFGKPVLVPAMGSIIEVQKIVGAKAICTYSQLTTEAISMAFNSAQPPQRKDLDTFSLEVVGKMYQDFFSKIMRADSK